MTTTPAKVQAFADTYDDDPLTAFEAIREARPSVAPLTWDEDDLNAFDSRCQAVYERVMAVAASDVRGRTEYIVGMFEPLVKLGGSERLMVARIGVGLDDREADLLQGLIECLVDDAEMRGYRRAFDTLERVVAESAPQIRERAEQRVDRHEDTE